MTVTGAARIFGALLGAARAASLLLPSALLTQTKRAGQQFPEVGPNFIRSYSSRSCCSVTACSVHALRRAGSAVQLIEGLIIQFAGHAVLHREITALVSSFTVPFTAANAH